MVDWQFKCQFGTELLINAMQIRIYSPMTVDTLMQRTGLVYDELSKRISCLEEKGVVRCGENEIKFTNVDLIIVNKLSNKALKMFMTIVDKIKGEHNFPD